MNSNKICFLQYNLGGGGAERKVCTLANYFVNHGYQVEIGLFGVNEVAYELDSKIKLTFIDRNSFEYKSNLERISYNLIEKIEGIIIGLSGLIGDKTRKRFDSHYRKKNNYTLPIQRFISSRKDTVFITMMVSTFLEILRVMDKYWKGPIPVPYLVMDCSDPKMNADSIVNDLRNRNYPRAARVLVMTQEAKDYFPDEIQDKCVVIPNPVRDDLPEPYVGERRKVVVNYCRLNRQKNLPMLIRAFSLLSEKHPDYKLEIYGNGDLLPDLINLINELELKEKAFIYPFDSKIHEKIRDCAMFVSSSDWEGFPNTVLEALSLGLPVISTDCDFGPRDMITDHENGLLVPVGNVAELANAMCELVSNPQISERMAKKARTARDKYSPTIIGNQWIELIEEVKKEFV